MGTREIMEQFGRKPTRLGLNLNNHSIPIGTIFRRKPLRRDKVKERIRVKGLTIPQVAVLAGMAPSSVYAILSGEHKIPTRNSIVALARVLELPVEELLQEER